MTLKPIHSVPCVTYKQFEMVRWVIRWPSLAQARSNCHICPNGMLHSRSGDHLNCSTESNAEFAVRVKECRWMSKQATVVPRANQGRKAKTLLLISVLRSNFWVVLHKQQGDTDVWKHDLNLRRTVFSLVIKSVSSGTDSCISNLYWLSRTQK